MGSNELQEKDATGAFGHDLSNGSSSNLEAARRLAKRLYHLDRFKRSDVAKHLGKKYVLIWGLWPHCSYCWFWRASLLNDNLYLFLCFSIAMNSASLWPKNILNFLTSQAWRWTVRSGKIPFVDFMFCFSNSAVCSVVLVYMVVLLGCKKVKRRLRCILGTELSSSVCLGVLPYSSATGVVALGEGSIWVDLLRNGP